jgi:hypothetical protein
MQKKSIYLIKFQIKNIHSKKIEKVTNSYYHIFQIEMSDLKKIIFQIIEFSVSILSFLLFLALMIDVLYSIPFHQKH